jgi:hypothetical protein
MVREDKRPTCIGQGRRQYEKAYELPLKLNSTGKKEE